MASLLNITLSPTFRNHTHLQAPQATVQPKLTNSMPARHIKTSRKALVVTAPTQKAEFRVPKTVLWLIKR